jgi:predicted acylesterase/phospholipase RssA
MILFSNTKTLSKEVFGTPSNDPKAAFNETILEQEIQNIVANAVDGGQDPSSKLKDEHPQLCPTFVVATRLRAGAPVRMRSYGTPDDDAFEACIWQAGRATSAAPTFFLPITINHIRYGDGGMGWSNPAKEAILEARNKWPDRPIGILISIGTGLEDALALNDNSNAIPKISQTLLKKYLESTHSNLPSPNMPCVVLLAANWCIKNSHKTVVTIFCKGITSV